MGVETLEARSQVEQETEESTEQHQQEQEKRVKSVLKAGYLQRLFERSPINTDPSCCSSEESAYLLMLEEKYKEVPEALTFNELKMEIHPDHRARIQHVWEKVNSSKENLDRVTTGAIWIWENAPATADQSAGAVIEEIRVKVKLKFRKAIKALISDPEEWPKDVNIIPLPIWQVLDKAQRFQFYNTNHNYLVALRIYYELLLEKPPEGHNGEPVLPLDHPQRDNLAIQNRYTRLLVATHQAIALSKAGHHQQSKRRLRKNSPEPYSNHPQQVMFAHNVDTIPYTIEDEKLAYSPVIGTFVTAMHDMIEDTALSIDDVWEFIQPRLDKYDSSLDQVIESGYGIDRKTFKEKALNLAGRHMGTRLKKALRVLSNNAELSPKEVRAAFQAHLIPQTKLFELLGIEPAKRRGYLKGLGLKPCNEEPQSETYRLFPEVGKTELDQKMDRKMTAFIIRLTTCVSGYDQQISLITKLEDRAHNLQSIDGFPIERQLAILRATCIRLIAWALLDYKQHKKRPLYNALPRLIDETVRQYCRIIDDEENADAITTEDEELMLQLDEWQRSVVRYEPPKEVQEILESFNKI